MSLPGNFEEWAGGLIKTIFRPKSSLKNLVDASFLATEPSLQDTSIQIQWQFESIKDPSSTAHDANLDC